MENTVKNIKQESKVTALAEKFVAEMHEQQLKVSEVETLLNILACRLLLKKEDLKNEVLF